MPYRNILFSYDHAIHQNVILTVLDLTTFLLYALQKFAAPINVKVTS
jgi:hypothetical protein